MQHSSSNPPSDEERQRENPFAYDGSAEPARSGIIPDDTVYWIPTDGATLHDGKRIPERMQFPFLPQAELGEVYTAWSNFWDWKFFRLSRNRSQRIWSTIKLVLLICSVLVYAYFNVRALKSGYPFWSSLFLNSLFIFAIFFRQIKQHLVTLFSKHSECSYVCHDGFVKWYLKRGTYLYDMELFKDFSHNSCLLNLVNDNSMRQLALVKKDGQTFYFGITEKLQITHTSDAIGLSLDLAWTKYLLRKARATIQTGNYFEMQASKELVFLFSVDSITLVTGTYSIKVTKNDVELFRFAYDWTIKFFIRSERTPAHFVIPLHEIPNYRAFLILIEHVLGIKMEGKKIDLLPAWHHGTW